MIPRAILLLYMTLKYGEGTNNVSFVSKSQQRLESLTNFSVFHEIDMFLFVT